MNDAPAERPDPSVVIERIQSIENISTGDKIDLILVFLEAKSASELYCKTEQEIQTVKSTLVELGFECYVEPPILLNRVLLDEEKPRYRYEIKFARTIDNLNKLIDADHSPAGFERDEKLGKVYGFPKTAADAYVKAEKGEPVRLLTFHELPVDIRESDDAPFFQIVFSAEHWQEEVAALRR